MIFFKRSFKSRLQLLAQRHVSDGYGGDKKKYRKVKSIKDYINKYIFSPIKNPYLSISCSLNGFIIPMLDVDDEEKLAITTLWLNENNIEYAIIQSSPGSFWVFPDVATKSNRRAVKTIWAAPGVDSEYKDLTNERKIIAVRGFCRIEYSYFEPELTYTGECSDVVKRFVELLAEHHQSEELKWLYRYQKYQNGDIDLADPKTGVMSDVALEDILK
jgi:hypothetical protein